MSFRGGGGGQVWILRLEVAVTKSKWERGHQKCELQYLTWSNFLRVYVLGDCQHSRIKVIYNLSEFYLCFCKILGYLVLKFKGKINFTLQIILFYLSSLLSCKVKAFNGKSWQLQYQKGQFGSKKKSILPVLCISESYIEIKTNFKAFIKRSEAPQRSVKIKI